jgi:hypothetical protein
LGRRQRLLPCRASLDRSSRGFSPNDFGSLEELSERLLAFQAHYAAIARPFEWSFTRTDLDRVIERVTERDPGIGLAA